VDLHGCDFPPAGHFPAFHRYARLQYRKLATAHEIPYENEMFDTVVGNGVLEHTANDLVALRELHRVLRDGGTLVLTFLPNRFSWTEFLSRLRGVPAHERLYGLGEARRLLLHHGFLPVAWGYHQLLPSHAAQALMRRLWFLNKPLERLWPIRLFASNLLLICRRRAIMR
jgi:SAM-dependent methyltransferase